MGLLSGGDSAQWIFFYFSFFQTYFNHAPFGIFDSDKVVLKLQIVCEFGQQVDAKSRAAHDFLAVGSGVGKSANTVCLVFNFSTQHICQIR